MNGKRVAIIGAGVSGLVAIKTCLEEGLQPVCFEKVKQLGGTWVYNEEVGSDPTGPAGIYDGLVTNVNKEMMAFSDFSFQRHIPPYPLREDVRNYYIRYAEEFDLIKHIQFNTTVVEVTKTPDFRETGRWNVCTQHEDGQPQSEIFDAVMVCTGMYSSGIVPNYPGQNEFRRQILHGSQFRCGQNFKDKTILVVGASHSAGDIAILSSDHAKKVYISMRDGAWIVPRIMGRMPTDAYVNQRWRDLIPSWIFKPLIGIKMQSLLDWRALGIQSSKHPANSNSVMINDQLPMKIMSGQVVVRSGLQRFEGSRVIFDDGSYLDDVDCVVYGTGYNPATPFLKENILGNSNQLELYMHVIPPRLAHPTLAAIGYIRSRGAVGPTAELQVRYALKVFKKEVELPSHQDMMADVTRRKDAVVKQYGVNQPKILPTTYNDELARAIGALPSFWSLLLSDPKLAYHFYFSPAFPPWNRMVGPHSRPDARQRILQCREDLLHGIALKTVRPGALKRLEDVDRNRTVLIMLLVLCFLGFLLAVVF
ncbi:dimethylaniline monooxygenase [N-oxide-forming] 5 [Strongylocentrotus purpuratus]|uniref:Flavin-containing monooxygenase n=1 Tax=Strongylocentrotus purpuratus TaxID=7668 RepID=A0A7M7PBH1_STRPU|nr:dimethylaniline monooxygenase [N-oxide-forming] 5 [Strongylocentrotus purpuratus]